MTIPFFSVVKRHWNNHTSKHNYQIKINNLMQPIVLTFKYRGCIRKSMVKDKMYAENITYFDPLKETTKRSIPSSKRLDTILDFNLVKGFNVYST